jgi:hypothetical protein
MIELKLRNIMKQVKSHHPEKRFVALDQLFQYKMDEGLEVQIDVLKDIIKIAAGPFPEQVDSWDNPSYYLIDFVCDFPMPEVVEGLIKHFDGFHLHAKERAIEFLLTTEDEGIFYLLEEKIIQLIQTEEVSLPIGELSNYPLMIKGILDVCLSSKVNTNYYKYSMYELVLALNSSSIEKNYKSEIVIPVLVSDYETTKKEYLKYNSEYNVEYVYKAWKDSYFVIRSRMRLFINLMEYYFTDFTEKELMEALNFNDPLIKTEALLICIEKNLAIDKNIIKECADNIESAEMIYWELVEKNSEHLYPITEEKQKHLAKTRLFSHLINLPEEEEEEIKFPEEIKIIDQVETENAYGQSVRYYLMSFKESELTYVAWVGGYALEDGDDTAQLWDGTYTEFVEFQSFPIEEHKQAFFAKRNDDQREYDSFTHYVSAPKLSKGLWFLYALLITQWLRAITLGIFDNYGLPLLLSLIALILTAVEKRKNKNSKVAIVGRQLHVQKGSKSESIQLHEIKKVEYNKKNILIYNKQNEIALKVPLKWVRYEQFFYYINEQTSHLKEKPYIQE